MTTVAFTSEKYTAQDLVQMCDSCHGWAISEQLQDILQGQPLEEQNKVTLGYIARFLHSKGEEELAGEITEYLQKLEEEFK